MRPGEAPHAARERSRASALPLLGVVGVAALILVPVPTPVVDTLLTLNLTVAIVVLLAAITTPSTRALSALPGLLVLTTLFRLALNVSTTRLILGQGDAGEEFRDADHPLGGNPPKDTSISEKGVAESSKTNGSL